MRKKLYFSDFSMSCSASSDSQEQDSENNPGFRDSELLIVSDSVLVSMQNTLDFSQWQSKLKGVEIDPGISAKKCQLIASLLKDNQSEFLKINGLEVSAVEFLFLTIYTYTPENTFRYTLDLIRDLLSNKLLSSEVINIAFSNFFRMDAQTFSRGSQSMQITIAFIKSGHITQSTLDKSKQGLKSLCKSMLTDPNPNTDPVDFMKKYCSWELNTDILFDLIKNSPYCKLVALETNLKHYARVHQKADWKIVFYELIQKPEKILKLMLSHCLFRTLNQDCSHLIQTLLSKLERMDEEASFQQFSSRINITTYK